MNKVILMGRLTRDPEVRYSQSAEPLAIVRYSLAVNKKFKRDGEPSADFINCTAFGKLGEFASKYLKKGQMISITGRLQVNNWEDNNGQKRVSVDVIIEEQFFAESKKSFENSNFSNNNSAPTQPTNNSKPPENFNSVAEPIDDDLPF